MRNPKQEGSNIFDCKPQSGPCRIGCSQCFYNREGAFYVDINKPFMPDPSEVGDGIMRVNSGHDSNHEREMVIKATEIYPHRFFNTSIAKFDFPAPVVLTANPFEETRKYYTKIPNKIPKNLMFVRLRTSSTNLKLVREATQNWTAEGIPVVLTFMSYYSQEPPSKVLYEWKVRHINSYWCATKEFIESTLKSFKEEFGRLVTMCGTPTSNLCKDCRNCETYYWQTLKHMKEWK
jgi:hypothetical protein